MPNEAGIKVYSIEKPTEPREIGYLKLPGKGVHRMWFTDGKYAHVGAMLPGIEERAYLIADLSEPDKSQRSGTVVDSRHERRRRDAAGLDAVCRASTFTCTGRFRTATDPTSRLVDAGMAILDISDISKPKTISHIDWSPPFGGYAHTTLPLPGRKLVVAVDESVKYDCNEGEKRVWLIDIREERNPVIVSTCPVPEGDFCKRGLRFGPHNVHENAPGLIPEREPYFRYLLQCGPARLRYQK